MDASFEAELARARVVPVLRAADAPAALAVAERLVSAGHRLIELTATTANWPEAVATARRRWPDVTIGAGTLRDGQDAHAAVLAGAAFLVSPFPAPEVRAFAEQGGVPFVEGGFTPGEVAAAAARGPAKIFPAHVGGPAYVRSLLALMPGATIVPTGGVQPEDVDAYLRAGAAAVGINAERLLDTKEIG
jgi:2-dehydro-3-deoxyphosphogluconate aldolase/(4S)-4-hydroxy-2-oxoglutarate aldolase